MGDEEDRKYLDSLPELEREKILNERHAKREENKKKKELLERLNEERGRSTKSKGDMEALRVKKNLKNQRERERRREKRNRDIAHDGDFSDDEYIVESDDDEFREYSKRKPRGNDSDPEYEHPDIVRPRKKLKVQESEKEKNRLIESNDDDLKIIQNICLKRNFLLKMSPHLYFQQTVKNCLVKTTYKIASDKIDYRIGKIIGIFFSKNFLIFFLDVIEKEENYEVETQSGIKKMNKYLIVKIGNEDKEFQFVYISNKAIELRELHNWLKELGTYNLERPTLKNVKRKHEEIKNILHSKYKAKEIKKLVEKRRETRFKSKKRVII